VALVAGGVVEWRSLDIPLKGTISSMISSNSASSVNT
jgi:hypothetical protein